MDCPEAVIEGLLYIAGDDGLTSDKIAEVLQKKEDEVREIINGMVKAYREDEHRGIELVAYGGKYKLVSKESVGPYAQKLFETLPSNTFSPAALETLAIIAYKQPVTRTQIEAIRGVGCEMIIKKLIARELVQECGRSDAPGRPILYEVTPAFMDTFKLESLSELPKLPDFEKPAEEKGIFE